MTTFFCADLHLNHANILKYDKRPFKDMQEHDYHIVKNWQQQVKEEDTVYILGDFGFGSQQYLYNIRKQLTGKIHLIRGNHDRKMQAQLSRSFISIKDYDEIVIRDEEVPRKHRSIVLCHYPLESWRASYHGVWHLHGHTHSATLSNKQGRLNVGIHLHNYFLLSYEAVRKILS
jgi:calcineurin-like phosphoesterase family protein